MGGKYLLSLIGRSGWRNEMEEVVSLLGDAPLPPAEIERLFLEAIHQAILRGTEKLETADIMRAVTRRREGLAAIMARPIFGALTKAGIEQ